ncbi:hypothetical protein F5883DRAFT_650448 [Diaporthe sp. PMI_573]|nr:hypothetical protein F5883DRAFT_650448 [Diaporthaceae sp. PMI_573]
MIGGYRKEDLHNLILNWITTHNLPFQIVESDEFKAILLYGNSLVCASHIPSADTLIRLLFSDVFLQQGEYKLFIFLNDFNDFDNEAAAELWARLLKLDPTVKGIYIAEPRWVNIDYYITSEDHRQCIRLVSKLQPPLEAGDPPFTTVLAGRLTEDIIKSTNRDWNMVGAVIRPWVMTRRRCSGGSPLETPRLFGVGDVPRVAVEVLWSFVTWHELSGMLY